MRALKAQMGLEALDAWLETEEYTNIISVTYIADLGQVLILYV